MGSRPPRPARGSACPARSIWARSTWSARHRTLAACGCLVRRSSRSRVATARCAPPLTRRCATGCRIRTEPTTASAPRSGRILIHTSCASCSRSSATRHASSFSMRRAGCRTWRPPASEAARTPSVCSTLSSLTETSPCSASRLVAAEEARRECGLDRLRPPGRAARLLFAAAPGWRRPGAGDAFGSAGLDYPAVGPEHALLALAGRVRYEAVADDEALAALGECCALEGILPAHRDRARARGRQAWARTHPGRGADRPLGSRRQGPGDARGHDACRRRCPR